MISAGRPDSVGGGVVAEMFRDRHKPARLSGGGGVVAEIFRDHNKGQNFFSGNRRSGSLKSPSFGNIFLHFPRIWKFSEIHCRKKNLPKVWGAMAPPWLRHCITDKPKSFWTFISKLRQDNQGIGDLHVGGSIVSDDSLKAEALNEQFNSVYITEEGNIPLPKLGESPYGEIHKLQISNSGVLDQLN